MKKPRILKRGIASLLAAILVVGLIPMMPNNMATTHAAESNTTTKTIAGLGTGKIANPTEPENDSDLWMGSYVYFGTYDTDGDGEVESVKYRVLDSNTTVFSEDGTTQTMLLDCDSILWVGTNSDGQSSAFDAANEGDANSIDWACSDIRTYLNETFLTNNFSTSEQSAIASSTKTATDTTDGKAGILIYESLNGDKIFFLDGNEATNTSYGYSDTINNVTNRKKTGGDVNWWLRSSYTSYVNCVGCVHQDGLISYGSVNDSNIGVSPALNVNLSSVLFSTVISGTAGETGAEYKLTLLDDGMTIASNEDITRDGDTITIPYTITGENNGNATQVSVLILDKEYNADRKDEVKVEYYGALDVSAEDGIGTFTLPSDLSDKICGRDYYAYIIAEDVNDTYETDYASAPEKIFIPWITGSMNFGTNGIVDPIAPASETDEWKGSYVYFGTYDTDGDGEAEPVKYRVLDSNTTVFSEDGTTQTMLLDCDSVLWQGTNPSSVFDDSGNEWPYSDIRTYLNETFLTNNFSTSEQSAIASSTKSVEDDTDGDAKKSCNYVPLNGEKVFFLDAKEATNTSYGYSNIIQYRTNGVKKGGNANWWLRSTYTDEESTAANVRPMGEIGQALVYIDGCGVSPALNVNLSSVLFSFVITGNAGEIGAEYKLTLLDSDMVIEGNGAVTRKGDTITVPYTITGAHCDDATQISVLILDRAYSDATKDEAVVKYYGVLDTTAGNGLGTFTLPTKLSDKVCGKDYYAYIFAEDVNGTYETDYASALVEITKIYDEVSSVVLTDITAPVAGKELDTEADCATVGIANRVPEVTWITGGNVATGNASYNTLYTASVTLSLSEDYVWADIVTATINGEVATVTENGEITDTITVTYDFLATEKDKLTSIVAPQSITVDNGTAYEDMKFPTTVGITTEGNTITTAEVVWNTETPESGSYDPDKLEEQTVTLSGTVTCPEGIEANSVELTTSITIIIKAHECGDADNDRICDSCKANVAYLIGATSKLLGTGDSIANISMNPLNGYVKVGEEVTVTAPKLLNYKFKGWYLSSDINEENQIVENAVAQSTDLVYSFAPEMDMNMVAVYEVMDKKVKVTFSGNGYTVSVNGGTPSEIQSSTFTSDIAIGSKVTVTTTDDGFISWINDSKMIVTTERTYTFTVTSDVDWNMSRRGSVDESTAMVEFISAYGQVIAGQVYGSNSDFEFPAGPSKVGYTFKGWSLTEGVFVDNETTKNAIKAEINKKETHIKVLPVYEQSEVTYRVDVYVNGAKDENQSVTNAHAGDTLVVRAPEVEGKVFLYWADKAENGTILGYDTSYFMQISKDIDIYAVYGADAVEVKPVISMTNIYTSIVDGKDKLSFSVTRDIPEGYTLIEHGVLYHTKQTITKPTKDTFILGAEGVNKFVANTTKLSGVVNLNFDVTDSKDVEVIARGYMILKDSMGNEEVYYTEIAHTSYEAENAETTN